MDTIENGLHKVVKESTKAEKHSHNPKHDKYVKKAKKQVKKIAANITKIRDLRKESSNLAEISSLAGLLGDSNQNEARVMALSAKLSDLENRLKDYSTNGSCTNNATEKPAKNCSSDCATAATINDEDRLQKDQLREIARKIGEVDAKAGKYICKRADNKNFLRREADEVNKTVTGHKESRT